MLCAQRNFGIRVSMPLDVIPIVDMKPVNQRNRPRILKPSLMFNPINVKFTAPAINSMACTT